MKYLSLFSGIGAFEKALNNINIDYKLEGFSEIDKYAIKSYCTIHDVDESLNLGDITQIDIEKLPTDIDLITHGSPCQDFSVAGTNKGGDEGTNTRSSLMWNTVEIVKHCKPKYVIWENVKNVLSKKHKHNFELYLKALHDIGYKSYYKVLNAKNYGVPQNRERIFVVSIRRDLQQSFMFPNEWVLDKCLKDILEPNVDKKYNLMKSKDFYLRNSFTQEKEGNGFKFRAHIKNNANIASTITTRAGSRMDDNYIIDIDLPYEYMEYTNNFLNKNNLMGEFEEIKNCDIRKLTPLECWRLMGFPDDAFYKAQAVPTSNTQLYKQAWNSIVVNVLEEIFKKLFNKEGNSKKKCERECIFSKRKYTCDNTYK